MTLNEMRDLVYHDACRHGLWDGVKNATDYEVRVAGAVRIEDEVQEAMDAATDPDHYAEELADVVITCLSVAGRLGIDIHGEVQRKMLINRCRPYQHKEAT